MAAQSGYTASDVNRIKLQKELKQWWPRITDGEQENLQDNTTIIIDNILYIVYLCSCNNIQL